MDADGVLTVEARDLDSGRHHSWRANGGAFMVDGTATSQTAGLDGNLIDGPPLSQTAGLDGGLVGT